MGLDAHRRPTSTRSRPAPRAGSPPCSSPPCRCRAATTSPAFIAELRRRRPLHRRLPGRGGARPPDRRGPHLPARRPRSSTGSPGRSATPSPAAPAARPCSSASTGPTSSSSRSTTAAPGTATTTSSPTCSGPGCSTSTPSWPPSSTGGPATGSTQTATGPRRSSTPWPAGDFERAARAHRAGRAGRCARAARRRRSGAGSRPCPTERLRRPAGARHRPGRRADGHRRPDRRRGAARPGRGCRSTRRPAPPIVFDHDEFAQLPAQVAVYRAGLALLAGDIDGTIAPRQPGARAGRARPTTSAGAAATALLGLAHWATGDLDTAERRYAEPIAEPHRRRPPRRRARLLARPGRHPARAGPARATPTRTFELGLRWTADNPGLRGAADMHVGLSEVLHRTQRPRRRRPAPPDRAPTSASTPGSRRTPTAGGSPRPGSADASGDLAGALELLDEAEPLYDTDFSPPVRPVVGAPGPGAAGRRATSTPPRRWADRHAASAPPTSSATSASTSTSPSPASCSPATPPTATPTRSTTPSRCSTGCSRRPSEGQRRGQRHRDPRPAGDRPPRPRATRRPRSPRWRRRCVGPSPRATSGSSSTPARRCRAAPCAPWPSTRRGRPPGPTRAQAARRPARPRAAPGRRARRRRPSSTS